MTIKLTKFLILCFLFFSVVVNADDIVQRNYIIVAAIEAETSVETSHLDEFAPIVYTGVGKVNAAIKLYEAILRYRPDLVINYGTAGSVNERSGLFHIHTFIQRDMDARPLGEPRGVTPFSNQKLPQPDGIVLGTGDSFVTNPKKQLEGLPLRIDLVDMEGFALREVCNHLGVEFQSYKYVSDSADSNASDDWRKNVSKGVELFKKVLREQYGISKLLSNKK
jgi:adenosylhomocysteine nucleosidase